MAGGNGNPEAGRLVADPAVRRQLVTALEEARQQDEMAVAHLGQALANQERQHRRACARNAQSSRATRGGGTPVSFERRSSC